MPNPAIAPRGTFTDSEISIIEAESPADLTPQERGQRAKLLTRVFTTRSVAGTPLQTSLIQQESLVRVRNLILNVVNQVADGSIDFLAGEFWPWLLGLMQQTLARVRVLNEASQTAGLPGSQRPATHLWDLFGGDVRSWAGIRPTDPELVTARYLEIHNPSLLDNVPVAVRRRLEGASGAGFVPGPPPPDESELRDDIRKIDEKLDRALGHPKRARPAPERPRIEFVPPPPEPEPPLPPAAPQAPRAPQPEELTAPGAPLPPETPPRPTPSADQLLSKYAPHYLSDLVGNPRVVQQLKAAIASNSFPPCYLFYGVAGIGKTTAAVALIRSYLRRQGEIYDDPSLTNPNLNVKNYVAFFTRRDVERAGGPVNFVNRNVVPVLNAVSLERTESVSKVPNLRRFVVLDDISDLSLEAQRTLGPELDKPSVISNATVVMTANDVSRLWEGLRSRCRVGTFAFQPPTVAETTGRLQYIVAQEGFRFPSLPDEIASIIERSSHQEGLESVIDLRAAIGFLGSDWAVVQAEKFGGVYCAK